MSSSTGRRSRAISTFSKHLLPRDTVVDHMRGQALLALQGPKAVEVLEALAAGRVRSLASCRAGRSGSCGHPAWISRSGYTGEDGFEISIPLRRCTDVADWLVGDERVKPIGLGARNSLRLEAGLPLYGHDIDRTTTPVMAGLDVRHRQAPPSGRWLSPASARIREELESGAPRSASASTSKAASQFAKAR